MTIFVTDKIGFVPRTSETDVAVWKLSQKQKMVSLGNQAIPYELMVDIIENGSEMDVFDLVLHNNVPTVLLEKILSYEYYFNTADLFKKIITHSSCTPEIIVNIFGAIDFDEISVLARIAERRITPLPILMQFLPIKDGRVIRGEKKTRSFEVRACLNKSVPVMDALHASQWINEVDIRNAIWFERVTEMKTFLTQNGVPVYDYPEEWVQELVWNGWTGGIK